jgi:hypothetical protein
MVNIILLFWIGLQLQAPEWFWWVWSIGVLAIIIQFASGMYKLGKKQ